MLSDRDILDEIERGSLVIKGAREDAIQPASIDLYLSPYFYRFPYTWVTVDPKLDQSADAVFEEVDDHIVLQPGEFVLGSTLEYFEFPTHLAGRLEGKSSLGRIGLIVHTTAGFFDPGFCGFPTIELVNLRAGQMKLYPGMPVAQMSIFGLEQPCEAPYGALHGSKYANQGPKPSLSQYHRNFGGKP